MNRIRNKKFLNIVSDLENTQHIENYILDKCQLVENYKLIYPIYKRYNLGLASLFKDFGRINKYSQFENREKLNKKPDDLKEKMVFNNKKPINVAYFEKLKNLKSDIEVVYADKRYDYYSDIFFKAIDPLYSLLDFNEKREYLKNVKLKVIDIFNKQKFYKEYDYSSRDFKKIDLDHYFTSNLSITLNMLKVYSDVLQINLIYKDSENEVQFMNYFKKNRVTVIIYEGNEKIYTIKKKQDFVRGSDLEKFLKYDKIPIKEILAKMKMPELHNIAKMRDIRIKKMGKVNKINKVKQDLINEILS